LSAERLRCINDRNDRYGGERESEKWERDERRPVRPREREDERFVWFDGDRHSRKPEQRSERQRRR
jgi:hypothetical protein